VENAKIITTAKLIEKFQQALDDKWGYIWGTAGVLWTAAKQAELEKTTDADREQSRKYGAKWIGHKVADCSGLFSRAFKQLGGTMYHGSNTMWNSWCQAKGELKDGKRTDGKPLLPGTAVFTYNKTTGKRGHVGLYIGGGYVIEARGARYGVVMTKLTDRPWLEWGELKGVSYDGTAEDPQKKPGQKEETSTPPTVRKGNRNPYVTQMQTMLAKLGYSLGICGIDGDFGSATEKAVKEFQRDHGMTVDGICGPQTWAALIAATETFTPVKKKLFSVIIPHLTETQAEALIVKYDGAISTVEGDD